MVVMRTPRLACVLEMQANVVWQTLGEVPIIGIHLSHLPGSSECRVLQAHS
jgi:hypothetical protein